MDYWLKQTDRPIFKDLLWTRPQTKQGAGKLLIIGGQAAEFSHVAQSYAAAEKAGAGVIRVLMPESTRKATQMLPNIEYAPSNSSGSFSKQALGMFFDLSDWADHVLLAGDFGKNSETTTVVDGYLLKCPSRATISENAFATIRVPYSQLMNKPLTLILSFKLLQRLGKEISLKEPITSGIGVPKLAEILHHLTANQTGAIVTIMGNLIWASANGKVSSTPAKNKTIHTDLAATCATWTMQNQDKNFKALTTACYELNH